MKIQSVRQTYNLVPLEELGTQSPASGIKADIPKVLQPLKTSQQDIKSQYVPEETRASNPTDPDAETNQTNNGTTYAAVVRISYNKIPSQLMVMEC